MLILLVSGSEPLLVKLYFNTIGLSTGEVILILGTDI